MIPLATTDRTRTIRISPVQSDRAAKVAALDRNSKQRLHHREVPFMRTQTRLCRALFCAGLLMLSSSPARATPPHASFFKCDEPSGILCAEQRENPGGS